MKNFIRQIQIILLLASFILTPSICLAYTGTVKNTYPKIANYYLSWDIPDAQVENLAKWDVLILDMEVQHNSLANLKKLRQLNPDIIILAYITSEEIKTSLDNTLYAQLRAKLLNQIDPSWWLKDKSGNYVSFWPGTRMLNLTDGAGTNASGQRWNDVLPQFVNDNIISTGLWDGVFYDNLWPDISWENGGNLDINNDGTAEAKSALDSAWVAGNKKMLAKTDSLLGNNYLIVANSRAYNGYQPFLNGIMLESFPAPWEADGTWAGSMKSYTNTANFRQPKLGIINANNNNNYDMNNFRKMRFSLGSALLGDGDFSFDYGVNNHGQTWWYDEYQIALGKAVSPPINILDKNNATFKKGIWRRDFENGIVVVNSTDTNQNYAFTNEEFNKIDGTQDRSVNNGAKINLVSLMGQDAVILLGDLSARHIPTAAAATPSVPTPTPTPTPANSAANLIKDSAFNNGAFVRVFNSTGNQTQAGFFAYDNRYPGSAQIVTTDIDNDKVEETLVNSKGVITIYRGTQILRSFRPFDNKFSGNISLAVADLEGNGSKEIVVGAGAGGGPQVRIFNQDGRLLNGGFFAYDRNFRGGVNVAVIDLNGDGTSEIITGAGAGGGPQVRIFNKDGKVLGGFFAYDKNSRNGVAITVGNVGANQERQIITGSGPGSKPQVRIWNKSGKLIAQFFAYDQAIKGGISVTAADIDGSGTDEILVGTLTY